jgi:Uma2 family endonuclease
MSTVQMKRWTREEYDKMIDAGIFAPGERVELIDGEILAMSPQNSPHSTGVSLTAEALRVAFGEGYHVRIQMPIALDRYSEPEPDVAVVRGSPRDYLEAHPSSPLLVLEVTDTTLAYDRDQKGSLYARAGIADYWVLNLAERCLEVYRDPVPSSQARYGWSYQTIRQHLSDAYASPLAAPQARILVADLLP